MTVRTKEMVLRALDTLRGDDLYRAKSAFRNKTQAEMDEQWGQSGKTCRQILAEHEAHDAKVAEAVKEVQGL